MGVLAAMRLAEQCLGSDATETVPATATRDKKSEARVSSLPPLPALPDAGMTSGRGSVASTPSHSRGTARKPAKVVPEWQTVELKPFACDRGVIRDCACCLCPIEEGDSVLAFPCPARHS